MFFGKTPWFDDILALVSGFENRMNNISPAG